jgi:hypothetical protein
VVEKFKPNPILFVFITSLGAGAAGRPSSRGHYSLQCNLVSDRHKSRSAAYLWWLDRDLSSDAGAAWCMSMTPRGGAVQIPDGCIMYDAGPSIARSASKMDDRRSGTLNICHAKNSGLPSRKSIKQITHIYDVHCNNSVFSHILY